MHHVRPGSWVPLVLLFVLAANGPASSQSADSSLMPVHVRGVPFSAEWRKEIRSHGRIIHVEVGRIARATNGSTFMSFANEDGAVYMSVVDDMTRHEGIISRKGERRKVEARPESVFPVFSQDSYNDSSAITSFGKDYWPNANFHLSPIGTKTVGDMHLVGQRQEVLSPAQVTDCWFSMDIDVVVEDDERHPAEDYEVIWKVSKVDRSEPLAELFHPPASPKDGMDKAVSEK